jgi:hypothetical protein
LSKAAIENINAENWKLHEEKEKLVGKLKKRRNIMKDL